MEINITELFWGSEKLQNVSRWLTDEPQGVEREANEENRRGEEHQQRTGQIRKQCNLC